MATQTALYNAALLEIGERKLASLSEDVEARRVIDGHYSTVLADCLEAGMWNFATRTVQVDADTSITPEFGYSEVFSKPSDWVRTTAVSADGDFSVPLLAYSDDVGYWSAGVTPIYVRYISNDAAWGLDLTIWPRSFTRYVELELALRICRRLTQSESLRADLERARDKAKRYALNRDALNEPNVKFAPTGSWNRARGGGNSDSGRRGGYPPQV